MSKKINLSLFLTIIYVRGRTKFVITINKIIHLIYKDPRKIDDAYQTIFKLLKQLNKITRSITSRKISSQAKQVVKRSQSNPNHPSFKKAFHTLPSTHSSSTFILAAGPGTRWQGSGHKQLAKINNKPIIKHTLDNTKNAIVISHHKKLHAYPHIIPSKHMFVLETLLSTQALWKERTIILLGDVYFDKKDLQKVINYKREFAVFGSKSQVEIFALSFSKKMHHKIKKHLLIALKDAYEGGRGKLWEFYHSFVGLPLHKIGFGSHFIELNNTTDIDTIEDYYNLLNGNEPKNHFQ